MTTSAPSKNYADDVSLLVVTLDTNPFFWSSFPFHFSEFLSQVLAFLNSILLLGQLNQVVVIATGCNSCSYVYDSASDKNHASTNGTMPAIYSNLLHNLDEFVAKDQQLTTPHHKPGTIPSSLLSGALSMALCYIQRAFRSGPMHPQPRILCLQGSTDGPEQYVAIMNAIFSAQRSVVPVDSCFIGSNNSAFLQQASYITGGIYYRPPQMEGLFQYLSVSLCFNWRI
ncbi:general transcription factor IIH subunit, putative [Medicago truncatula]|uniref:General transcription and DNA repair factor IIH subunit TFB4 n=1 Tax=Medicago truncatula TaxID=3880 RepID=A0A072V0D1_MEDTR|nr:general transcription factor IIH subunit, putative [Medicago truncatula]